MLISNKDFNVPNHDRFQDFQPSEDFRDFQPPKGFTEEPISLKGNTEKRSLLGSVIDAFLGLFK